MADRHDSPAGTNRLWVADLTLIPTAAGFLYLAVILGAWSPKAAGWSMANHLRAKRVLDALDAAVARAACRAT